MAAKKQKKSAPAKSKKKVTVKKPAAKKTVSKKPAAKPAKPAKKATKPVAKPVSKPATKPVAKPIAKPATKPVAKPVEAKPVVVKKPEIMPASKKTSLSKKAPLPSRVIKKDPIVVTKSPESLELIKKTIEPRIAREIAEAAAYKQANSKRSVEEKKAALPVLEKKKVEKKPMVVSKSPALDEADEKRFYTREELEEFRKIIVDKLTEAKDEYKRLVESLHETNEMSADGYNMTEFGSDTLDKEQTEMFLARQKKFIDNLERAMVRIENGTYGRCKVTGKLIPKERLRLVPHTESSIQAKQQQYEKPNVSIDEF